MSFNWNDYINQTQYGANQNQVNPYDNQGQQQGQLPNPFGYQDPNMNYGGPANSGYNGMQRYISPFANGLGGTGDSTTMPVGYPDMYARQGGGNPYGSWPHDDNNPNSYLQYAPQSFQQQLGLGGSVGATIMPVGYPDMYGRQGQQGMQGGLQNQVALNTLNFQPTGDSNPFSGDPNRIDRNATNGPYGNAGLGNGAAIPNATDNYGPGLISDMQNASKARDAAAAQAAAGWTPPPGAEITKPNYSNLYGGFGPGWQQGFNELNNKQFTDNSDAFKSVFGSTQGTGAGNNYNWNVYPGKSWGNLSDPAAQAEIVSIAQANPQYDFEPTMVNGQWVLASRARDISQQKSLLAPVLPPTNTASAARTSSGGGYSKGYSSVGSGAKTTAAPKLTQGQQNLVNTVNFGLGALNWAAKNIPPAGAVQPNATYDNSYPGEAQQFPYTATPAVSPNLPPAFQGIQSSGSASGMAGAPTGIPVGTVYQNGQLDPTGNFVWSNGHWVPRRVS